MDHTSIDDAFIERLRGSFTDPEIFDLTICLSAFLGWAGRCGRWASPRRR